MEYGIDGVLRQSKHDVDEDRMASTDFYGDLNVISRMKKLLRRSFTVIKTWFWRRENGFDGLLQRSKYDFDDEKMDSTAFYGDLSKRDFDEEKITSTFFYGELNTILTERIWHRRYFAAI